MSQCVALTTRRTRCKNLALPGSTCCRLHQVGCPGQTTLPVTRVGPSPRVLPPPLHFNLTTLPPVPTVTWRPQSPVRPVVISPQPVVMPPLPALNFPPVPVLTLPRLPDPIVPVTLPGTNVNFIPLPGNAAPPLIITSPRSPRVLSPRSPQSPRLPLSPRRPQTPTVGPTSPVGPPGTVQECSICLTNLVSNRDLLACGHPVCLTCLASLRDPRCPVCRRELEGPTVTNELMRLILARQDEDAALEETRNMIVAMLLQENPRLDPQEAYTLAAENV